MDDTDLELSINKKKPIKIKRKITNKSGSKRIIKPKKRIIKLTNRARKKRKPRGTTTQPYIFLCYLWNKIKFFIKDQTIKKYLAILGLDPTKFQDQTSDDFNNESKKLVKAFFKYPTILTEIFRYIITRKSKLAFLDKFSIEQIKYITNLDTTDTKLIATAGSGKLYILNKNIIYLKYIFFNYIYICTTVKSSNKILLLPVVFILYTVFFP